MIYFCVFGVGLLVGVIIGLSVEQHQAKKDIEMLNKLNELQAIDAKDCIEILNELRELR